MATIIRTLEEQGHWEGATEGHWIEASGPKGKRTWVPGDSAHWVSEGWVPVKDQVVTQGTTSVRRGALTQRTVEAWQSGRGRRTRSPYQVRALSSARGVLAPEGVDLIKDPITPAPYYRHGAATITEPDMVPVVYPPAIS